MHRRLPHALLPAVFVLLVALLAAAGCGGDDDSTTASAADEPELVVFAAASLTEAFEESGDQVEGADVKFSFAGSDDLAAQIRQGVPVDVYAAANTSLPDELAADGLLESPETFATNKLVIGVPAGSEIDDVADLEEPGTTVAIGDPEVPVGAYTREVLGALGADASEAILDNVATSEPDVAGIVAKINQGAVDAGFIYQSDVDASEGEIEAVTLPSKVSPDVAYGIAVSSEADQPELAEEFVSGAVDGTGQDILIESGFGPPPAK